jgi:hypothetical protein
MQVLKHHVYEYKKGIRNMVLHTMKRTEMERAIYFLQMKDVSFLINEVNETKINVFFGNQECVEIVKLFRLGTLSDLTPEQDFMLGIMLGYSREQQYARFLKQSEGVKKIKTDETNIACPEIPGFRREPSRCTSGRVP